MLKIKPLVTFTHTHTTLIKCKTHTGKYHQIRKMLHTLGKPIVCNSFSPGKLMLTLYKIKFYNLNAPYN
ncbi:hypothetical protein JSR02_00310 [Candidatus Vidania fulgoroideae]|uniref:Uncharacterized protein n=1 Tax=Candidatus Vidania fulgoroideorum TaxID=881286 RepID=A0A974X7Q3_9PROT|nr:hypothetical protein JSR02_00310 [Candidatus Vidania fulgoroideae]